MRDNSLAHPSRCSSGSGKAAARLAQTLSRLGDAVLMRRLARLVARDRATTAMLVAHIAEVDARRLYAPAGYPSMHAYCVGELRLSEDAAWKRIQAARAARKAPALLCALAEGRLHLSAVCLLAPHIAETNAEELISAATDRSKSEIEAILWRRFAPADVLRLAPGQVDGAGERTGDRAGADRSWGGPDFTTGLDSLAPGQVIEREPAALTSSPAWTSLHITISISTHEKLRYAQALLSHALPSGDPAKVLDRALDALIARLEKRKFGAGAARLRRSSTTATAVRRQTPALQRHTAMMRPRTPALQGPPRKRHIPAAVRRAVWERDQGRCTFVGAGGHRCESRRFLEFDHAEPVARGGVATVAGVRLRCRTHNQHEAERVFGAGFMETKRREARQARVDEHAQDILACLRELGCRSAEARRAAEIGAALRGATLEERLRVALQSLGRAAGTAAAPGP